MLSLFADLETETEIFEKLEYFLWSPSSNGQNARFQASFDFGTNLTCDTKIENIKVIIQKLEITSKFFKILGCWT